MRLCEPYFGLYNGKFVTLLGYWPDSAYFDFNQTISPGDGATTT